MPFGKNGTIAGTFRGKQSPYIYFLKNQMECIGKPNETQRPVKAGSAPNQKLALKLYQIL